MSVAAIGRVTHPRLDPHNPSHQTPISSSCHIITPLWTPSCIVSGYLVTKSNDVGGEEVKKKRLVYSALCARLEPHLASRSKEGGKR